MIADALSTADCCQSGETISSPSCEGLRASSRLAVRACALVVGPSGILVRTNTAVGVLRPIAVLAERLKAFWKAVSVEPCINPERHIPNLLSMLSAIIVDVIDAEELLHSLTATDTFAAIVIERCLTQTLIFSFVCFVTGEPDLIPIEFGVRSDLSLNAFTIRPVVRLIAK